MSRSLVVLLLLVLACSCAHAQSFNSSCLPGYAYKPMYNATQPCWPCQPGTFCTGAAGTVCELCPPGQSSGWVAGSCVVCAHDCYSVAGGACEPNSGHTLSASHAFIWCVLVLLLAVDAVSARQW